MNKNKNKPQQSLQTLRNIGPALEEKLHLIGVYTIDDFIKSDPEDLYYKLQFALGQPLDRCVLYCFQGAKLDIPWHKCKRLLEINTYEIKKGG